jgi:error-prone DNA polymerase
MGFYAPAQLVQDARRHGVEVRAVDVTISQVESTLEPPANGASLNPLRKAVRLGLNRISGLKETSIKRIVEARIEREFDNVEDLAMRAQLNSFELEALAASGALATLAGHRHQAGWEALGVETRRTQMLKPARFPEPRIELVPPTEGADIVADYERLGLTLGRHPLALLRPRLAKMKMRTSIELQTTPSGRITRACGIVTHRQRPQTAKGSVFVTIEDETGPVNIIFWNDIFERERKVVVGSTLLGVQGVWQSEAGVMHLLAKRATDYSRLLGRIATSSRDFH